jgi:hypothetical protein
MKRKLNKKAYGWRFWQDDESLPQEKCDAFLLGFIGLIVIVTIYYLLIN